MALGADLSCRGLNLYFECTWRWSPVALEMPLDMPLMYIDERCFFLHKRLCHCCEMLPAAVLHVHPVTTGSIVLPLHDSGAPACAFCLQPSAIHQRGFCTSKQAYLPPANNPVLDDSNKLAAHQRTIYDDCLGSGHL